MNGFGDAEPEDSWHPDDAVPVLVDNLVRRLVLLRVEPDCEGDDPLDEQVDELHELIERARDRGDLTARDRLRIRHLDDDLAHVRSRLR